MDQRDTHTIRTYQDFIRHGIIRTDDDCYVDASVIRSELDAELNRLTDDIEVVFADRARERGRHLTTAALLKLMVEGGSNDDIERFVAERGLSKRFAADVRRHDAIRTMGRIRIEAERFRAADAKKQELVLTEKMARSLDDTLFTIQEQGKVSEAQLGSLRLVFGTVAVGPGVSQTIIDKLTGTGVGLLRGRLQGAAEPASLMAQEGERILRQIITRGRDGYPTVRMIAARVGFDEEVRKRLPYGSDLVMNQRLIETSLSHALDGLFGIEPDMENDLPS